MGKCKYIYNVYVDASGFAENYTVKASSSKEAHAKAKAKALKDFSSTLKATIEDREINY